ncbi:MAG: AAA family ATPase [Gammaproteobacteria bacterium]
MTEAVQSIFPALTNSIFEKYGKIYAYTNTKKSTSIPFKEHPQLSILADILTRKNSHHLHLTTHFSKKLHPIFLEALLMHLTHDNPTKHLRQAELVYLPDASFWQLPEQTAAKCFEQLHHMLEEGEQSVILALNHSELMPHYTLNNLSFVQQQFLGLLSHPNCRFIFLTNHNEAALPEELYTALTISGLTSQDIMAILKQQRVELEEYHHIYIADDLLSQAYTLAERYISTTDTLNQALLLLDSSAARTATIETDGNQTKPALAVFTLMQVLASWTSIPTTHLPLHKFKLGEFVSGIQQRVFGQEQAVNLLGHEIQQAQARLQDKNGPFCSLLLVGLEHTGKKTAALALTEQLFKQINLLYIIPSKKPANSLLDMMAQPCGEKRFLPLKELINQKPNAVILFEAIESLSADRLNELIDIVASGYLHDNKGNSYNFRQAIILLTTTKGTLHLKSVTQNIQQELGDNQLNLMQLIMNEQTHQQNNNTLNYSADEITQMVKQDLHAELPAALIEHCPIIPFLPLDKTAIEQMMRLKLKVLDRQLHLRFGVELGYAPEVIRYLTNEAQMTNDQAVDIEKALKPLYFTIEQAVLLRGEQKTRLNQLFLQLNETGQVLRCDWLIGSGN